MLQPFGFEDPKHPNYVYKLIKTINDLKQALILMEEFESPDQELLITYNNLN